jgi:sugar (pentulose or hexulose) kinase
MDRDHSILEDEVVAGAENSQSAMAGMNCIHAGDIGVIAGMTSPVMQNLKEAIVDSQQRTWSNVSLIDNQWILESNSIVTGLTYRWVRDCFFQNSDFSDIERKLNNTQLGIRGVLAFFWL